VNVWRDKLLAFAVHFIVTALLAAVAAALIFLVWFPAPFNAMIGGTKLFVLVVGCDLALGPLLSLVIFNRNKARRLLVLDYALVALVQLSALVYGVGVMAGSRPAYIAFTQDRFEVVAAQDISDADLADARDPHFARRPLFGPEFVTVIVPAAEEQDSLFQELAGHLSQARPRFYVPFSAGLEDIRRRGGMVPDLEKRHPDARAELERAVQEAGVPPERLRWLPVAARLGFWTALVDVETGAPLSYAAVDPY
jgi:hypothetical protein